MTGPATFDDTSTDYKRFEAERLAQDHDAARQTADLTDTAARHLVNDLVDEGVVTPVAERRVLVHNPSSVRSTSTRTNTNERALHSP